MTEPSPARPIPGPPHHGPSPRPVAPAAAGTDAAEPAAGEATFADLASMPVAEHVAVFEAEHSRLQRELATIDQL